MTLGEFKKQTKDMPDEMIITNLSPQLFKNNCNMVMFLSHDRDMKYLAVNCKSDMDVDNEIEARIQWAMENQADELDFFIKILEDGYTLEDFKYDDNRYIYAKEFMESHGLI